MYEFKKKVINFIISRVPKIMRARYITFKLTLMTSLGAQKPE
jgi:hypothetical protein